MNKELTKFVLVGMYNTLFGYVLYVIFFYFLENYNLAYSLAFVLAAAKSFYLYSKIVFKTKVTLLTYLLFPFGYILQYLVGILLIGFFVDIKFIDAYVSGLLILPVTAIISYIYNKFVFEKDKHNFIIVRGILRKIISKYLQKKPTHLKFSNGKYGKPYLDVKNKSKFFSVFGQIPENFEC